jgi:hypothetical protein
MIKDMISLLPMAQWLKIVKWIVVILLATIFTWKGYNYMGDFFGQIADTKTKLSNERIKRERVDAELAVLRSTITLKEKHDAQIVALRKNYQDQMDALREEAAEQVKVLKDRERLERLTIAKPKLVERLANKATKDRLDELESVYNN